MSGILSKEQDVEATNMLGMLQELTNLAGKQLTLSEIFMNIIVKKVEEHGDVVRHSSHIPNDLYKLKIP